MPNSKNLLLVTCVINISLSKCCIPILFFITNCSREEINEKLFFQLLLSRQTLATVLFSRSWTLLCLYQFDTRGRRWQQICIFNFWQHLNLLSPLLFPLLHPPLTTTNEKLQSRVFFFLFVFLELRILIVASFFFNFLVFPNNLINLSCFI